MNIYLNTETDFIHNGLGFLTDVLKANVTDNLNGDYSLYFEYKIDGHLNEYLKNENIVKCQVSDGSKQLFIIKNVIKTFDSIQVSCKHIFYLLLDNFVEDTAPTNLSCQPFLDWVLQRTNYPTQFQVFSDIANIRSARYVRKNPVEIILGDEPNSIVNLFGGEIRRDNFNIHFNKTIGNDNGVKLIIGKNITGINITMDTNSVYTRIMPQGFDGLFLPEKYVDSPLINNYINPKIYKVEFSDIKYDPEDETAYQDIEEAYSALRNATNELFESGIDKPIINVKVNWIELSKTNEYKNYSNLEKVMLGDILTVNLLGLVYKTKVIKTVYNPLTDRIESFEIGSSKANIGTSTNIIQKKVESINPNSILESAKDNATQLITQAMGGYVYKTQNEMFIMDTDNPNTAVKVWRWNMNGLGYSKNGIDGPYEIAMTSDGQIVADFITTGKLNTNVIEGYDEVVIKVKGQDDNIEELNSKTEIIEENIENITETNNQKISDLDNDLQAYKKTIETQFSQTTEEFNMKFIQEYLPLINANSENINENQDMLNKIERFIRFVSGNIIMGEEGSIFRVEIIGGSDGEIRFMQGDTKLAYFNKYKLYVPVVCVFEKLQVGNDDNNFYWAIDANTGNLDLNWGGSE